MRDDVRWAIAVLVGLLVCIVTLPLSLATFLIVGAKNAFSKMINTSSTCNTQKH